MEWWNTVDVYENSHTLHLKCASYMYVIEADDASVGVKLSDEAFEVSNGSFGDLWKCHQIRIQCIWNVQVT